MKKILVIFSIFLGLFIATPAFAIKVFKAESSGQADVSVYVTDSKGVADCVIFVSSSSGTASGNSRWYYESSGGVADVSIFFAESAGRADKAVFFTESQGLAKCDVDWKSFRKKTSIWTRQQSVLSADSLFDFE